LGSNGQIFDVAQLGAGKPQLFPGAGVQLRSLSGLRIKGQYGRARAQRIGTDEWQVYGDLEPGFSPLELSPELWLDASDTSTITESSGSVSEWRDRSGNARHFAQGTGINQPTTGSATLNALNVITFDGSDDYLVRTTATAIGRNVTGITTYTLARWSSLASQQPAWAASTSDNVSFLTRLVTQASISANSKANVGGRTLDADGFASQASSTSLNTSDHFIVTGVYDIANTDISIYLGSTLEGTNTSYQTATTTSDTDSVRFVVGAATNFSLPLNGSIAEIIIYHGVHNATQRQYVWDYLAAKWGLTL
jgi:hypothetical protein